ncbi:MAG: putative DNA-binding domain-containing protein [Hydrogenophilales bacterium]|nr:putative DNA-binding domain-containing protein [Hydrogenophilales bacterium]
MNTASRFEHAPMSEAQRQRELIDAIFSLRAADAPCAGAQQNGARWRMGLAAYRGNGRAHARNALRVQFPSLLAMLGAETFDALCFSYWRACPPRRGDLAWIGEALPAYIETLETLAEWPWLADCARLDWAVWQMSGAPPAKFSEDDLRRLIDGNPAALTLKLSPGVHRLPSAWPIASLYDTHRQAHPDWEAAAQAIAQARAQTAWVWRPHGDLAATPVVEPLDAATDRWIAALGAGQTLDLALDSAGEAFDFTAWLERAIRQGWLDAVVDLHAPSDAMGNA